MTTAEEDLAAAQALISDPAHWTQGWGARDKDGREVEATSAWAVCWCATGAINRTTGHKRGIWAVSEYLYRASRELFGYPSPIGINDRPGHDNHAEVMTVYTLAREMARNDAAAGLRT